MLKFVIVHKTNTAFRQEIYPIDQTMFDIPTPTRYRHSKQFDLVIENGSISDLYSHAKELFNIDPVDYPLEAVSIDSFSYLGIAVLPDRKFGNSNYSRIYYVAMVLASALGQIKQAVEADKFKYAIFYTDEAISGYRPKNMLLLVCKDGTDLKGWTFDHIVLEKNYSYGTELKGLVRLKDSGIVYKEQDSVIFVGRNGSIRLCADRKRNSIHIFGRTNPLITLSDLQTYVENATA